MKKVKVDLKVTYFIPDILDCEMKTIARAILCKTYRKKGLWRLVLFLVYSCPVRLQLVLRS